MDERKLDDAIFQTAQAEAVAPMARRVDRADRRSSRGLRAAVAIAIIGLLLSYLWSGWNTQNIAQNEARYAITQQGLESLREANEELRARGLKEIPEPREGESINMDALAAAAAAIVKADIAGDYRFGGPQGPRGEPCIPATPGCAGPPGPSGPGGPQGQEGPSGPEGSQGPMGPEGKKGDKGDPGSPCDPDLNPACVGPQGPPGRDGMPPCPEGYTPTWEERLDGKLQLVCDPSQG